MEWWNTISLWWILFYFRINWFHYMHYTSEESYLWTHSPQTLQKIKLKLCTLWSKICWGREKYYRKLWWWWLPPTLMSARRRGFKRRGIRITPKINQPKGFWVMHHILISPWTYILVWKICDDYAYSHARGYRLSASCGPTLWSPWNPSNITVQ